MQAILALSDGTVFHGRSAGAIGETVGEVVFNTAMTGYQEILSDPSYASQIVTLTYPHIGNTGANPEDMESRGIFAAGLVVRDMLPEYSNWRGQQSLRDFLIEHNVVAIADIDTRQLTRHIRKHGSMGACILAGDAIDDANAIEKAIQFPGLSGMDLAKVVTIDKTYQWDEALWSINDQPIPTPEFNVIAIDFGVKYNILRHLVDVGCAVTVVPAATPASEIVAQKPDGIFLSNGPGDPEPCDYAIDAIRTFLDNGIPVFGICLGHQLLALASGAKTMKMKCGHHGANHPVKDIRTEHVMITSQNHGFTVDESDLPSTLEITHRSLFDQTIQGLRRTDCPAFSFQGHPEASPGPQDVRSLFTEFATLMRERR